MDFSTFLLRFGFDPNNFENNLSEPIQIFHGFIHEARQRTDIRKCPFCGCNEAHIHGYYYTETRCNQNEHITDILRIKRVRFKCSNCKKVYSPEVIGVEKRNKISSQVKALMMNDFQRPITFEDIGRKYGLSTAGVMKFFDRINFNIPRRQLPEILCIDEIRFESENNIKYCCVLYDYSNKRIIDIIKSRQMPYLREYFSNIRENERQNVKIFISDMYDGYRTVKNLYFKNAIHIVDKFHVVTQLNRAVNSLRLRTMNGYTYKGDKFYNFMKSKWKYFLCRSEIIPNKYYVHANSGEINHYDTLVFDCIKLDNDLWDGYNSLQDLYHHPYSSNFEESLSLVLFLSNKLKNSNSNILKSVGNTYFKWRVEIANAYTRDGKEILYTNAIAECINNKLKTIIKAAYGYRNFERFRKRALLICSYSVF